MAIKNIKIQKCNKTYSSPSEDGHAAKTETELVMAYRPELVHMDRVNPIGAVNQHRLDHMNGIQTPVSWYADHPTHQDGDPTPATGEIGRKKYQIAAEYVAELVRKIKEDAKTEEIMQEYYSQW